MKGQPDHRCENVPKGEVRYLSLFTGDARPEKLLVATVLQGGPARKQTEFCEIQIMILVKLAKYLFTLAVVLANTTLGSWEYSGFNHSSPLFSGKHLCGENPSFLHLLSNQGYFHLGQLVIIVKVGVVHLQVFINYLLSHSKMMKIIKRPQRDK